MSGDGNPDLDDDGASVAEDVEATLVYDAFRASVEAGHPADPEKLLAEHPALADRLKTLIAANNLIAGIAGDVVPNLADYRIVRELGRGGMGIVYEAEQISRGRRVAIKVLTATAAMDPQQLKRFLQVEVPAAKLLRHAHIVPMVDFGCDRGVYYYAMQFIGGQNLAHLIKARAKSDGIETDMEETAAQPVVPDTASKQSVVGWGRTIQRIVRPTASLGRFGGPRLDQSRLDASLRNGDSQRDNADSPWTSSTTDAPDLLRSVARWGLQAAEALDYAHGQGVVHRDIKPSNLLLDDRSNVWITDFGLAHIQGEAHFTATGDLTGTPRYMSPEQVQAGQVVVDHRTDIYSLGATLYELLTLRPAFEGDSPQDVMRRVVQEEPTAPRRVNPDIPRDLETIVLKAMAKERDDRYQSARELADDLRRFLDRVPIQARRLSPLDRASRWSRQHRKAVVTAIALLLAAVVGLSVAVFLILKAEARAVTAKARAVAAEDKAEENARGSQYESLVQQILRVRLTTRAIGWSDNAWGLVREAAKLRPRDRGSFQAQAAATLMEVDAHLVDKISAPASSLSFDPTGKLLWMGGLGQELRTWDSADHRIETRGPAMEGPIAFRADGTPLQLGTIRDAKTGLSSLQLWDAAKQTAKVITLPDGTAQIVAHAISAEGTHLGAVVEPAKGKRSILVWETATSHFLPQIDFQAAGLAFSPDASLVAAWDEGGKIGLWKLPELAPLATLHSGDTPIRSVAFGRARGLSNQKTVAEHRLLAAGDSGGTVTVWDLKNQVPINYCRGSFCDIYAVAFSPDGTTLASAGRGEAKLWDVATGNLLLSLGGRNTMTSVAFSPDGTRLVIGSEAAHGSPGGVDLYRLENGRGIRTLRGLRGQVLKTIFSPDGRLVAGLSQDWQVAVWDRASGQLRIKLDVPQGLVADNSGLAFSPDGRRFAFSAGHEAKLWDLDTGKELGAWTLPEGTVDSIAFPTANQVFLLRVETKNIKASPTRKYAPNEFPCVLRLRSLLGDRPTEPLEVITDFNWHVHRSVASADGKYFVVEGLGGPEGNTRSINAYDASSGAKLWSYPSRVRKVAASGILFDATGRILLLNDDDDSPAFLMEMPGRAVLGTLINGAACLSPGAQHRLEGHHATTADRGLFYSLHEQGRDAPLLQVAINSRMFSVVTGFSPDGRHVIWGNSDGSVSICDLDEVRHRLSDVGLGW